MWAVAAIVFLTGICSDIFGVLWDTGLQQHISTAALSRVSSYDALGSLALGPLGLVIVGPIAEAVGVRETLIGAGAVAIVCAAPALLSPEVRNLEARSPAVTVENQAVPSS